MTIPLRKLLPTLASLELRFPGLEFEKSSEINFPGLCGHVAVRKIFVRLASGTFLSGLQKKLIETS